LNAAGSPPWPITTCDQSSVVNLIDTVQGSVAGCVPFTGVDHGHGIVPVHERGHAHGRVDAYAHSHGS
jgi:hypothetical protein